MKRWIGFLIALIFSSAISAGQNVKIESTNDLNSTVTRYTGALKKAQIPVLKQSKFKQKLPGGFSREGLEIVFPNPFYGWSLGECHRGERKDKPLVARVWTDNEKKVWLEYPQPEAYMNEFGVIECGNETDMVSRALSNFADAATE